MRLKALIVSAFVVLVISGCTSQQTSTSTAKQANQAVRLGCSAYCQTAGGYGGEATGNNMVRLDTAGTVAPQADGTIPLTFTCLYSKPCLGTVWIDPVNGSFPGPGGIDHGSDFVVNGTSSRTLAVPLPPEAVRALHASRKIQAYVSVDVARSFCPQLSNPTSEECLPTRIGSWKPLYLDQWTIALSPE